MRLIQDAFRFNSKRYRRPEDTNEMVNDLNDVQYRCTIQINYETDRLWIVSLRRSYCLKDSVYGYKIIDTFFLS